MLNEEIIDQVRAIRDAHAATFGYDLRTIFADLKKSEAEHIAAGHPFIPAPSEPPAPRSALQRARFVRALGVSRQMEHGMLAECASVSPEMAVRLGAFFGNGPQLWIDMQTRCDLWLAEKRMAGHLPKPVESLAA